MKDLWENLKRRHVFHVAVIYAIVGWIVAQVTVVFAPALLLPGWFATGVVFLVILGFPIALVLAWAFELTPEGIKRSEDVLGPAAGHPNKPGGTPRESDEAASIAVLPFTNMSDDPDAEHLADGMTEDIITGLAHDPHLSVVSRNAVFLYKNKPADLREVGRELGVRYILEGSLRQVGERIRVTTQLIETRSGNHVWAKKFDRIMADLFEVQDEVIEEILDHLGVHLKIAERERYRSSPEDRLGKWGKFQRAMFIFTTAVGDYDKILEAKEMLEAGIAAEPDAAYMHALLSFVHAAIFINAQVANPWDHFEAAREHMQIAYANGSGDPLTLTFCGATCLYIGDFDQAISDLERALSLTPNEPMALQHLALTYAVVGRHEEAMEAFARAERSVSGDFFEEGVYWYKAMALAQHGEFEEATKLTKRFLRQAQRYAGGYFYLGLLYALQDQMQEAAKAIRKAGEISPETKLETIIFFMRNHYDEDEAKRRDVAFREAWELAFGPGRGPKDAAGDATA